MKRIATRGFTLVELVVVIIVLALLAAVALPRFVDMSTNARVAAVKATLGAVSAAATLAGSKCQLTPGCFVAGAGALSDGPDGTSNNLYNGYPTGLTRSFFYGIKDWISVQGFTVNEIDVYTADFTNDGAPDPNNCKVRDIEAAALGSFPSIVATTNGC